MHALILAGGKGTRLMPYTADTPKPLLPIVGHEPILSIILRQLARAGFTHVTIAVNHMADQIIEFCGEGSQWGITIDYVHEDKPLHTIGPVTLLKDIPEHILIVNGDTLTNFDHAGFLHAHIQSEARISVAVTNRETKIEFLVVSYDADHHLTQFEEKPTRRYQVTNGMTCLSRSLIEELPKGEFYGLDNLLHDALARKDPVNVFESDGFWMDIGRPADYLYLRDHPEELKEIL